MEHTEKTTAHLIESQNQIEIIRLQETLKTTNYRVNVVEEKIDELSKYLEDKFEKFERENQKHQKELLDLLEKAIAQNTNNSARLTAIETHQENVCKPCIEDVKEMKSLRWKAYGVVMVFVFILSVWGSEILKLFQK